MTPHGSAAAAARGDGAPDMEAVLAAIRRHCLACSGGSRREVQNCPICTCNLHPYRQAACEARHGERGARGGRAENGQTSLWAQMDALGV